MIFYPVRAAVVWAVMLTIAVALHSLERRPDERFVPTLLEHVPMGLAAFVIFLLFFLLLHWLAGLIKSCKNRHGSKTD